MKFTIKRKRLAGGKWKIEILKAVASEEFDSREDADAAALAIINQFADDFNDDDDDS